MDQVQRDASDDADGSVTPEVCPAPEFDQFAKLAATLCCTPMSAVTFFKDGMQWIKGALGLRRDALPSEKSFCIHTIRAAQVLEVRDTLLDERFRNNDFVTGEASLRFYVGVPLIGRDGQPVGALCVVDTAPRPAGLTTEQRRALEMLATQASLQLNLQQTIAERDAAADEARKAIRDLQWAVNHDYMTGLGNRALLRQALGDIRNAGSPVALLAIDVDHFKRVNDSFGHQAGDELLKEIGKRLIASVRSQDVVVRFGGDEFAIVLRDMADDTQLASLASRLLDAMQAPLQHDGRTLECRITIGGARTPADTADMNELVRFADAALCEAKTRGRGRYVRFEAGMLAEQSRRITEIACAREALAAGHIIPFYQPKVDIADGSILGLEALLRVVGSDGVPVAPSAIAAAFKEPDLAQALGESMMTQVLADMQAWTEAGINVGRVAVNLSAVEVGDPTFAARLLGMLRDRGIAPGSLEIEIIEDVLLDERSGAVLETVNALSAAGISIAFDDFGTGYAALAHVPKFPVNVLKIDRSFVSRLDLRANQAIIAAILSMAGELNLEVVAEGVETVAQAAELLRLGCTQAQGFLYSQAVPARDIVKLIRSGTVRARPSVRQFIIADRMQLAARAA